MWNLIFPKLSSSMRLSVLVTSEHLEESHHLAVYAAFVPLWRVLVTYCRHAIIFVISITGVTMSLGRQTGALTHWDISVPCSSSVEGLRFYLTQANKVVCHCFVDARKIHRPLGQIQRTSLLMAQQVAEASLNQMCHSSPKRVICVTHVDAVCSVCVTMGRWWGRHPKMLTDVLWELQELGHSLLINGPPSDQLFSKVKGNCDQIVVRAIRNRMADSVIS